MTTTMMINVMTWFQWYELQVQESDNDDDGEFYCNDGIDIMKLIGL